MISPPTTSSGAPPTVSVIIPCRNEIKFLGRCLDSILASDYPGLMEVLVCDGESTDGTAGLIERYACRDPRVRRIANPRRTTPWALNLAIEAARGEVIARVDAHAAIAPDYLRRCVEMLRASGADNVGGVMRTLARDPGWWSEPIIAALSHRFGVGNSYFRIGTDESRWVDTVFGGCWRREVFDRVGRFNPGLDRSQDMEFSLRLKAAGGRTLLAPSIRSDYFARSRFFDFVRHNFRNGEWAILPFVHSAIMPVSPRHLVPLGFAVALTAALSLLGWTSWPLAAVGLPYAALNAAASLESAVRRREPRLAAALPVVFFALHLSYGLGSISGAIRALAIHLRRRPAAAAGSTPRHLQEKSCTPLNLHVPSPSSPIRRSS